MLHRFVSSTIMSMMITSLNEFNSSGIAADHVELMKQNKDLCKVIG